MFGRLNVNEQVEIKQWRRTIHHCEYHLDYELTKKQKNASLQIMGFLNKKRNILIYAACGAGKTELTLEPIKKYLNQGKKVCFAIPRRQVVLEIRDRMAQAFPELEVIAVCEGYQEPIDADLIICTMHQLYRYHQAFDLLILDEVDAFPYYQNEMLEMIASHASIGEVLYLSATPDDEILKRCEQDELALVELFERPHGFPLVIPTVRKGWEFLQYLYMFLFIWKYKRRKKQILLFAPSIALANKISFLLSLFRATSFTSKTVDKEERLQSFLRKEKNILVCTTVLERGITLEDVQVLVLHSDHSVFSEASLIQIAGRVGRKKDHPTGKCLFLCLRKTRAIKRCVKAIISINQEH